jgi:hypothetical protein
VTARGTTRTAAVDVGLSAVLRAIRTARRFARLLVASSTLTIGGFLATSPGLAALAVGATAVGVGLFAILDAIRTGRLPTGTTGADAALAIGPLGTTPPVLTTRALVSPAIGVGLISVWHAVRTRRCCTATVVATDVAGAVPIGRAPSFGRAGGAVGAAAVGVGLFAVEDAIRTRGVEASACIAATARTGIVHRASRLGAIGISIDVPDGVAARLSIRATRRIARGLDVRDSRGSIIVRVDGRNASVGGISIVVQELATRRGFVVASRECETDPRETRKMSQRMHNESMHRRGLSVRVVEQVLEADDGCSIGDERPSSHACRFVGDSASFSSIDTSDAVESATSSRPRRREACSRS